MVSTILWIRHATVLEVCALKFCSLRDAQTPECRRPVFDSTDIDLRNYHDAAIERLDLTSFPWRAPKLKGFFTQPTFLNFTLASLRLHMVTPPVWSYWIWL